MLDSIGFCAKLYIYILAAMLGAAFASFAVCAGYRIAHGKDWINERSICDTCGHVLGFLDLIPIFSYIFLRGKCRYCGAKIPPTSFLAEVGMALLAIISLSKYGLCTKTFQILLLAVILLIISVVDMIKYEIPDECIVAGIILWVITVPSASSTTTFVDGIAGGFLIGGGMLLVSLIFDRILKKDSLGGGDIKLFFMTGLFLGWKLGIFNLILSCLIGLVFVFVLKKDKIPFGPSISIATIITLLYGNAFLSWYLGLLVR